MTLLAKLTVAGACAALVACAPQDETVWSAEAVISPEGAWMAQDKQIGYSVGFIAEHARVIELRRANTRSGDVVVVLEGEWQNDNASDQAVRLRWPSPDTLEVIVPNLTLAQRTRAASLSRVAVRVVYRDDSPAERMAWLHRRYGWALPR